MSDPKDNDAAEDEPPLSDRTRVDSAAPPAAPSAEDLRDEEGDSGEFPRSNTIPERIVQRRPPLVSDPALDTWSVDLPVPAQPAGEQSAAAEQSIEAFTEGPAEEPQEARATRLLPSEPIRVGRRPTDTGADAPPDGDYDDGWGSRSETGAVTQSHSLMIDADGTGGAIDRQAASNDAPRLVCIEGPDKGKEFVLTGRDISIGRGPENDVVISDSSMSRVHCRILLTGEQVLVTDQRSANGTLVNGSKVDRAQIKSGATIKLGQSLFRFIEMGDVIKPAETQSHFELPQENTGGAARRPDRAGEGNRRVAVSILAAGAVIALLIVLFSIASSINSHPKAPKVAELAEEHFLAGVTALKDKHIDEALDKFREAAAEMPDEPRYGRHVRLAEEERGNLQNITACSAAIKADNLLLARSLLSRIAPSTIYTQDLAELQARVTALSEEREQATDVLLDKKKFSAADREGAAKLLADLQVVAPEAARTKSLAERLQVSKIHGGHADNPRVPAEARETHAASNEVVLRFFSAGQIDQAISAAGSDTALRGKLQKFSEAYREAKTAGRGAGALPALKRALAAEQKIDSAASHYAQELKPLAADADCDAAAVALSEQRNTDAYRFLKDAQTLVPGHPVASKKLGELSGRARDLFNQGYILKDSELKQARDKWKTVLGMVPPEDEAYQKAKKWLDLTK